jgi:hypothetical protein
MDKTFLTNVEKQKINSHLFTSNLFKDDVEFKKAYDANGKYLPESLAIYCTNSPIWRGQVMDVLSKNKDWMDIAYSLI